MYPIHKKAGLLFFATVLSICLANAQTKTLVGTVEPDPFSSPQKPSIVITHFEKTNGVWKYIDENTHLPARNKFNVFYASKKLTTLQGKYNYEVDTTRQEFGWYKIITGAAPKIGKKSTEFTRWDMESMYRPLVASTVTTARRNSLIKKRKGTDADLQKIFNFLIVKAKEMELGEIPPVEDGIVAGITSVLIVNDSVSLIEANVNVNIYCYLDSIPFSQAVDRMNNSMEKSTVAQPHGHAAAPKTMFLIKGNSIQIIGRNLKLLDYGDYDQDGYDEILFQQSLYNRDGYIMVVDKYRSIVNHGWSYH